MSSSLIVSAFAAIAIAALIFLAPHVGGNWLLHEIGVWSFWPPLYAALWAVVMIAGLSVRPLSRFFAFTPFRLVGRCSFSVYLLHCAVIGGLEQIGTPVNVMALAAITATIAISQITYQAIERTGIDFGRIIAANLVGKKRYQAVDQPTM